jgi:plasmid stabilization system protein ParE
LSYKVYVRRAAELDIARAQIWYETQQPGLAAQFHSEIGVTMNLLSETPLIYPILYRDVRRAVLHRFPYLVWFRLENSTVNVLACTHGKTNPINIPRRVR